jgi:hypothetical protein
LKNCTLKKPCFGSKSFVSTPFNVVPKLNPLLKEPYPMSTGTPKKQPTIDDLCINTIRTLSMDAVQKANSGHPGAPMGLAPAGYVLWTRVMRHNPQNPDWPDRDRFVLSGGHASMLLYSLLHLTGYNLSLEEIQNFRQWGSKTPAIPNTATHPVSRPPPAPGPGVCQRRRHGHGGTAPGGQFQSTRP